LSSILPVASASPASPTSALDDQEVGAPVPERQDEPEAHRHAEPLDPHGVGRGTAQVPARLGEHPGREPTLHGDHCQFRLETGPPADRLQAQERERQEAEDDHEELQDLVVDRTGQAAEEGVPEHDRRRQDDADVDVPAQELLEQHPHGVHADAGGEDRHHRE